MTDRMTTMRCGHNRKRWMCASLMIAAGCADVLPPAQAPLFLVPLSIEGQSVGNAIIDTGGVYEVLLRDEFHLTVVGDVEVLVFGGRESVRLTEGFSYAVGGIDAV